MAFQQPNNVRNMPARGSQDNWKNDAFINLYLPRRDKSRAKLGSIGLKMDKHTESQVIEFLQNAPDLDEALAQLKDRIVIDFNMADGSGSAELDLG